jgi:hypothetical protein
VTPRGDAQREYELARLFELGSPDAQTARGMAMGTEYRGRSLSTEQRRQGDAWARATFARSFHGRPVNNDIPELCN